MKLTSGSVVVMHPLISGTGGLLPILLIISHTIILVFIIITCITIKHIRTNTLSIVGDMLSLR